MQTEAVMRRWAWMAVAALLAGCGGGGGGDAPSPPPPPSTTIPPLSAQCEANSVARFDSEPLVVGRSTELHLLACGSGALSRLRWALAGPSQMAPLSTRSQSLSFTPTLPGAHRFSVRFSDAQGREHSGSIELSVAANDLPRGLLTRGEPSSWSGDRLSLRAWPLGFSDTELAGSRTRWERVSGPDVTIDQPEDARLLLTAPTVSRDELLVLRATLTRSDGSAVSDEFRLLVQPPPNAAADPLFGAGNRSSRVVPWLEDGPLAALLARCIYNPALQRSGSNLCTLGELPLLGQVSGTPSVEQIMQRVLVSHDWQAEVFEHFLREQDPSGDLRRMLAATTAIVIGGRVRPAFYWSATGAIYLDAAYLWLTPEQRDTLSEAPDPRSAYGQDLRYSSPWRYVKDNAHATPARPVTERGRRELAEIRVELGRLLYHELAHAADFLPPRAHPFLAANRRVYEAIPSNTASEQLQRQLPFFSQEMVGLGKVLFFGDASNAQQRAYTPEDVAQFFSQDRVNDDYSYSLPSSSSVPREDAAMLVEEAMVQLRYGVLRDFAFVPSVAEGESSADKPVVWGQRGRIGEPLLRPRLELVLAELMPWVPATELAALAAPQMLRPGLTWGQNLDQAAVAANRPRPLLAAERLRERELDLERARHAR